MTLSDGFISPAISEAEALPRRQSLLWRAWLPLKHRLEYAPFVLVNALLRRMSIEAASDFSGRLWRALAPYTKRHKRALAHLTLAFPEKSPAAREAIARASWENLGRVYGEAFHLEAIAASDRIAYENLDVLEQWTSLQGGKVACAGHLANWELAIAAANRFGLKPWGIYQRIRNPFVDRYVARMRVPLYEGRLVPKSEGVARQFIRLVNDGEMICLLADQRQSGGVEVPFFGRPAYSSTFPALLARNAQTPVLMVRMRRLPGVRFVQSYELIETPVTQDRQADIVGTTAMIQAAFERYIRETPEQWTWGQRRWSARNYERDKPRVVNARRASRKHSKRSI